MSRGLVLFALLVGVTHALKVKDDEGSSVLETESQSQSLPFQETIWKFLDRNKDGFVSVDDLKKSMHFKETAEVLMAHADKNKDKKLSKLEFFGTVSGATKVPGDPGSAGKWMERNFDPVVDMKPGQKYPELCSKEFWDWASQEWLYRKISSKNDRRISREWIADWHEYAYGGNQELQNFNPEVYLQFLNRQASVLPPGQEDAFPVGPYSGVPQWDVCLRLLPLQKRLKMSHEGFKKWRACYAHDLAKIAEDEVDFGLFTGIPRNSETRRAMSNFYRDYHVNSKTNCGLTDRDFDIDNKFRKWGKGCYFWMACWTDEQKWVPQSDNPDTWIPTGER